MHKVLRTPELLDKIFSHSSRHTNTATARICRIWFNQSIPFVWGRVQLDGNLSVLSPFTAGPQDGGFLEPSLPFSWDRFFLYSRHIRFLECFDVDYTPLTQAVIHQPSPGLFSSKLTRILWGGAGGGMHIKDLLPLLTPSLQHLDIFSHDDANPEMIDVLCKTLPIRSPSLLVFRMEIPATDNLSTQAVSRSLSELLPLLLRLIAVSITLNFINPDLFEILSQLPRLEDLTLLHSSWAPSMGGESFERKIIDDEEAEEHLPFHSLNKLHITDRLGIPMVFTTAKFLAQGIQLLKLTDLTCAPGSCENSGQVIALMESMHNVCPNLQKMRLSRNDVPWQAIQALLKCSQLVDLGVSFDRVDMDLQDIITLATNRSSWKFVSLPSLNPLSYQALVVFAQNCPELHTLGLTLDIDLGLPDLKIYTTSVKFTSLTLLDPLLSVIKTYDSEVEVAMFLSTICRYPLKIKAQEDEDVWNDVEKMVNAITLAELENRTLEREEIALLRSVIIYTEEELAGFVH